MIRSSFWCTIFLTVFGIAFAHSAPSSPTTVTVTAKADTSTFLASAPCIVEPVSSITGTVEVRKFDSSHSAFILVPAEQRDSFKVELRTGKPDGVKCVEDGILRVEVLVDTSPEISTKGVQQAFTVLMAAFVLALLMESAFELLFNWRLFQAYFVGRAWRTPIMFLASLVIVTHFKLDLLAEVFAAYHGGAVPSTSWASSMLTAMVLSGGSVGVNRLLVSLNFRSAIPRTVDEKKKLSSTEAYVSIDVHGIVADQKVSVEMQEVDNTTGRSPTLAIITAEHGSRLKKILFPSRTRFPTSGGMTLVASAKCYRFMVRDLQTQKLYNVDGTEIQGWDQATEFCFAPRSIVDFVVDLA